MSFSFFWPTGFHFCVTVLILHSRSSSLYGYHLSSLVISDTGKAPQLGMACRDGTMHGDDLCGSGNALAAVKLV